MKIVNTFSGLGDSVYARPFIRALCEREDVVYVKTPIPDFYSDLKNIKFIKPKEDYRTQTKHMNKLPPEIWVTETPRHFPDDLITIGYNGEDLVRGNIMAAYERKIPLGDSPFVFDLPKHVSKIKLPMIKNEGKKIALVRPVTIRAEWVASARAPRPEYIIQLSQMLMNNGYHVVTVADVVPNVEVIHGPEPNAHQKFHNGELDISQLMALTQQASLVVGGVGWIVPFALAARTPLFVVFGGQGLYNQVSRLTDFRMDLTKMGYALPEKFCRCSDLTHNCPKFINNLDEKFWDFMVSQQRLGNL